MVDKATMQDSVAIVVARWVLFTVFMVAAVMAVDIVALWLLNLLTDVGTWTALLLFESLVMILFGVAGWGFRGYVLKPVAGWKRPRIYHVTLRPRYPDFWISLAVAGVVLFISDIYLVSQYY